VLKVSTIYLSKPTAQELIANLNLNFNNIARILESEASFRTHTISYQ